MLDRDIDDRLREHAGLVKSLADRFSRRDRNERDDLEQEGMIAVWQCLTADKPVTEEEVEKRMTKWLKFRGRQKRDVPTSYDKLLPLEELHAADAAIMSSRPLEGAGPDAAE